MRLVIPTALAVILLPAVLRSETCEYTSTGRRIPCERTAAREPSRGTTVVLMHGRSSLDFYAWRFRDVKSRLAAAGYDVLIPLRV